MIDSMGRKFVLKSIAMMSASSSSASFLLGYLAFVPLDGHSMVGGYLIVTDCARPVEFHCTAPVCPSKTHEILYGPTLRSVLCGEQIGPALVSQTELRPQLLITDEASALAMRAMTSCPIALVEENAEGGSSPATEWSMRCGRSLLTSNVASTEDHELISQALAALMGDWEIAEPLERIRAAIQEAQKAAA